MDAEKETFLEETCGVKYDESSGEYHMIDSLAGLSDDEKTAYEHIPSSVDQEAFKDNRYAAKYGETYLNNAYDTSLVNANVDAAAYEEMTMCARATDQGYLASLSNEDRTELLNEYMSWRDTHTTSLSADTDIPVYGWTDEELASLTDEEKVQLVSDELSAIDNWSQANATDIETRTATSEQQAERIGTNSVDLPSTETITETTETENEDGTTTTETTETTESENDTANSTASTSTWGKITATVGAVATAFLTTVKTIGQTVYNKVQDFIKEHQDNVEDTNDGATVDEEKTSSTSQYEDENTTSSYVDAYSSGETAETSDTSETDIEDTASASSDTSTQRETIDVDYSDEEDADELNI